jgi:glucose/mannose-6-phosphate isomerase
MTERPQFDEYLLDDADAIAAGDPGEMLRAVASASAQVREAAFNADEIDFAELVSEGRPRAIVVAGMGGSAMAGDVLAAVLGTTCPVPVFTHRGYGLPGWVGPADLVTPVSCSGGTEETLSAAEEALRRGCRMFSVGAAGSPLAESTSGRGPFAMVPGGRQPRASLWSLAVPLITMAARLGLTRVDAAVYDETADLLDGLTDRYGPARDAFLNPAKTLAVALAGKWPLIWGTSQLAGVAANRFSCQLAENAKSPSTAGVLPEGNHNQVVAFDGPAGRESTGSTPLRLVVMRDENEHAQVARRAEASVELATERGIEVDVINTEGGTPLAHIASLIALGDFTSTYLALLLGLDPTPVDVITELKSRIRQ